MGKGGSLLFCRYLKKVSVQQDGLWERLLGGDGVGCWGRWVLVGGGGCWWEEGGGGRGVLGGGAGLRDVPPQWREITLN